MVKLDGILLAVVKEQDAKEKIKRLQEAEEQAKAELKESMKEFETKENAVGIILLETENGKTKINPVIWVKTIDTLYYETACGSGSLATAIYQNKIEGRTNLEIVQPSGYSIFIRLKKEKEEIQKKQTELIKMINIVKDNFDLESIQQVIADYQDTFLEASRF